MRVVLDKNFFKKDMFDTIETWKKSTKIGFGEAQLVNFCKLTQITKKLIISGRLYFPLT